MVINPPDVTPLPDSHGDVQDSAPQPGESRFARVTQCQSGYREAQRTWRGHVHRRKRLGLPLRPDFGEDSLGPLRWDDTVSDVSRVEGADEHVDRDFEVKVG